MFELGSRRCPQGSKGKGATRHPRAGAPVPVTPVDPFVAAERFIGTPTDFPGHPDIREPDGCGLKPQRTSVTADLVTVDG